VRGTTLGQSIPLRGFRISSSEKEDKTTVWSGELPGRTTNDEETAKDLDNDKRYSFEALLKGNPADIANAEKTFALTKDTQRKQRKASILLSVGVKDQIYFDYLADEAKKALAHDHDMPWPIEYGEDGLNKSDSPNPAFVAWCEKHELPFWEMYNIPVYELPNAWYYLGAAGDPRAYDLLVKGLRSFNLMIAGTAAQGLAKLQDPRAINELIAIGGQLKGEPRILVAESLLFFNDPKAQAAADELMPRKGLLEIQRRDIKTRGMKVLFPW